MLATGIALLAIDDSKSGLTCTKETSITRKSCHYEEASDRGLYVAGGAVLLLIGTAVAWSSLTPKDAKKGRKASPKDEPAE